MPTPAPSDPTGASAGWIKRHPILTALGALFAVSFALIHANAPPPGPTPPPPPERDPRTPMSIPGSIVAPMIGPFLKDPDSAKYQTITMRKRLGSTVFCGEVNSKNSFGGYVGWRSFIITSGGFIQSGVEIQTEENQRKFLSTWNLLCAKSDLDDKPSLPKRIKRHGHA